MYIDAHGDRLTGWQGRRAPTCRPSHGIWVWVREELTTNNDVPRFNEGVPAVGEAVMA